MMKKILILFIAASISFSYACTNSTAQVQNTTAAVQETTIAKSLMPKEFAQVLAAKKDAIVLDVRTPREVAAGHLAKAVNIDIYNPDFAAEVNKLDKSKPVFVYCHSGKRSARAMAALKDMGFTEIYNLANGISGWRSAGMPVVQ